MPKYIDADEFVRLKRKWYCEACEKRKGMKRGRLQFVYEIGGAPCRACDVDDMISDIEDFPAADFEPKRRWIPVTEKPPEAGVIVWDGDHTPFTADEIVSKEYDGETMYFVPKYMVNVPIIAWMSPPEPPEVE